MIDVIEAQEARAEEVFEEVHQESSWSKTLDSDVANP
jgi:hypothetical protein